MMNYRIYAKTERAINMGLDWDEARISGEIETIAKFDTYEELLDYYFDNGLDAAWDIYAFD